MTITKHAVRRAKTRGLIPRTCSKRRAIRYINAALADAQRRRRGAQWELGGDGMTGVMEQGRVITVW